MIKFGNIPDGGGWDYVGRFQRRRNAVATARRTGERGARSRPLIGTAYVHTVIDDDSRVAYAEICADEKATTAIGVLNRAVGWFAEHGVTVERVLSDNGSAHRSYAWREACAELGITAKRTRPTGRRPTARSRRFSRGDRSRPSDIQRLIGTRRLPRLSTRLRDEAVGCRNGIQPRGKRRRVGGWGHG